MASSHLCTIRASNEGRGQRIRSELPAANAQVEPMPVGTTARVGGKQTEGLALYCRILVSR